MDLKELFNPANPKCIGCPILEKPLPQHHIMDYELVDSCDVLFVSDAPKIYQGDFVPFRGNEWGLINRKIKSSGYTGKVGFISSVKCPSLTKDDLKAAVIKTCRQHLIDSIVKIKPKIVFACGSMATKMFYGKNVKEGNVRGKSIDMEMGGHNFKLVSIFHPYQVIAEPKNEYLFDLDIKNNIESTILGVTRKSNFKFVPIFSIDDLNKYWKEFTGTTDPIAVDIETTGLNFLTDLINTVALSVLDPITLEPRLTIAFPLDHKKGNVSLAFKARAIDFLCEVFSSSNYKVGQNFTFDLKFLKKYGVDRVVNLMDTKICQHLFNEDVPKSLRNLVNYYFPNETI